MVRGLGYCFTSGGHVSSQVLITAEYPRGKSMVLVDFLHPNITGLVVTLVVGLSVPVGDRTSILYHSTHTNCKMVYKLDP